MARAGERDGGTSGALANEIEVSAETPGHEALRTTCCVADGGPSGMMLGYLLARGGVDVVVLEKHADFLRDFRGDTIHPSTLELMYELGILGDFLRRPHQEVQRIEFQVGGERIPGVDFSRLPTHCKFIAFMPQWEFLDFIAEKARAYPTFHLLLEAGVTDLVSADGRIEGVVASTPAGEITVRADLVVGADGRHSTVRGKAGLPRVDLGSPIDVLWMRVSRRPDDPEQPLGTFGAGKALIMLNRGDYWQCGYLLPKGGLDSLKQRGLDALHGDILSLVPHLGDRVNELKRWEDIKLLTVTVDRLTQWARPGLLCIGDAAHAMSPVAGVGINLAIQDAVAAANLLLARLRERRTALEDLKRVQQRRELPTRLTQFMQVLIQNRVLNRVLANRGPEALKSTASMLRRIGALRFLLSRLVGIGFRSEHVETPDILLEKVAGV